MSLPDHLVALRDAALGIWFPGATEEEVKAKVREFWAAEKAKAEAKRK